MPALYQVISAIHYRAYQCKKCEQMNYKLDRGWVSPARHLPSPNFGSRPKNEVVSLLVLHNISLPPGCFDGNAVERFFTNTLDFDEHPWYENIRGVQVSAHLFVRRDGELIQFVSLDERAWHAGRSHFDGRDECNDFSIGIEIEGTDNLPYTDAQYVTLGALCAFLQTAYPHISDKRIVGHSDIAPGRKTDPGDAFEWSKFRRFVQDNKKNSV